MSDCEKQQLQTMKKQNCEELVLQYQHQTTSFKLFIILLTLTTFIIVLFTSSAAPSIPISFNLEHYMFKPAAVTNTTTRINITCPIPGISPFYIYTLPPEYNTALLNRCRTLSKTTNMCTYIVNNGLGPHLNTTHSTTTANSWYATNQFTSELIFHARASSHPCRVTDPSSARLFYIPFYGGLHASSVFRIRNLTTRDTLFNSLATHLTSQPLFTTHSGHNHFLLMGRVGMDFMRPVDSIKTGYGQNSLFNIPSLHNTSLLSLERDFSGQTHHQFAIPYPSYFHPTTAAEMMNWQDHLRTTARVRRNYLFSFIGGTRKHGGRKAALRDSIVAQCNSSLRGAVMDCSSEPKTQCNDPSEVMRVSMESEFCLQPPGDSFTRRSTFDSMLAGCVPVFFKKESAYTQYGWYLPEEEEDGEMMIKRERKYSVFIDMGSKDRKRIEQVLGKIKMDQVWKIRENIVNVLPRVTYMNPDYKYEGGGVYDAVDVTLQGLSRRVQY